MPHINQEQNQDEWLKFDGTIDKMKAEKRRKNRNTVLKALSIAVTFFTVGYFTGSENTEDDLRNSKNIMTQGYVEQREADEMALQAEKEKAHEMANKLRESFSDCQKENLILEGKIEALTLKP